MVLNFGGMKKRSAPAETEKADETIVKPPADYVEKAKNIHGPQSDEELRALLKDKLKDDFRKAAKDARRGLYTAVMSKVKFVLALALVVSPLLYDAHMNRGTWRSELEVAVSVFLCIFAVLWNQWEKR